MALNKPLLYGPTGKPLALSMYPSRRFSPHLSRPMKRLHRETVWNVSECDHRELVNTSRNLFAQVSNLGAAVIDKNSWAFGDAWEPHYTGKNAAWGDEATAFLRDQFFPNCDVHGRFDYTTCLYLSGVAWDRDGDDLMLLTEDRNGTGFPKLEFIPATRIQNSNDISGGIVQGGQYDGYRIFNGVIFDDAGTPVAVRVVGLEQFDGKETYQDYSIGFGGNADLAYPPEWADQGRGIPLIGRCSLDWNDVLEIDEFLKRGVKRASAVGLIAKNKEGEAPMGNEVLTTMEESDSGGTNHSISYEEIEGGEMYYISRDGDEIEGLNYKTPHPNVEKFIERVERRGLKAIGWSYELIYLAESGRAATRLVCQTGNKAIWRQQKLGIRRTWRAVRYAIAKAQKNGFLSRNPDPRDSYFSWDFGLPAEISVDLGNDEQAEREALKMGLTSKALYAQKRGYYGQEIRRQRQKELMENIEDAQALVAASGNKLAFDKALDIVEQRGPNLVQPQGAAKQSTAASTTAKA